MKGFRSFAAIAAILLLIAGLYNALDQTRTSNTQEITYSELVQAFEKNEISSIKVQGERIRGYLKSDEAFYTIQPPDSNIVNSMVEKGIQVEVIPQESGSFFSGLGLWLPMIILIGVWFFFLRKSGMGGRNPLNFGKSKARLLDEKTERKTFQDVAGIDEARAELIEIVEFLKDPRKFMVLGGKIPKGALLIGPPGTGKTLLARAIAGEADVPFFTISGSDFVEMFVGVGASRVRDMFEQAKKNSPCILFIDEIDAVGRNRGVGYGGGNDEREQTLNQLLVEMDGFETNEGVILIAATNRPDVLDPALLRPGRFDRQITVPNPDIGGREQILRVHVKPVPMAPDVDLHVLARGTPGFSGADLANLVNEAALLAARLDKRMATMSDFEAAKDRVMMGTERRSLVMSDEEKRLTAYHEAGHAIVGINTQDQDPIHKATIIPRGRTLGLVLSLPERDHLSMTRQQLSGRIAMLMGGRAAEEMVFDKMHVTSGASSDIQQATRIARSMVTRYGMSEKLGTIDYGEEMDNFAGQGSAHGPSTQRIIDLEIRHLVDTGYQSAVEILAKKRNDLETLATNLLEYETLTGAEITVLLAGGKIVREEVQMDSSSIPTSRKRHTKPANLEDEETDKESNNA